MPTPIFGKILERDTSSEAGYIYQPMVKGAAVAGVDTYLPYAADRGIAWEANGDALVPIDEVVVIDGDTGIFTYARTVFDGAKNEAEVAAMVEHFRQSGHCRLP